MGLGGQVLIFALTILSYAFGLDTYFNHPTALNATEALSLGQAIGVRLGGLIGNTIGAGITACLGWALGGLLPNRSA
jgi:hypothetical protein